MLQNARFTVFTFSKLLTENQQGGGGWGWRELPLPQIKIRVYPILFYKVFWYKVET